MAFRHRQAGVLSARAIAARVVERVLTGGAFAAAVLDAELSQYQQLSVKDRALATQLVYATLRTLPVLEERILRHARRAPKDAYVRSCLLIAACQILLLHRIPPFAAVDEAVSQVRGKRGAQMAGFVNAVLRRLSQESKLDMTAAVTQSVPAWLMTALKKAVGDDEALLLVGADVSPLRSSVRVVPGRLLPESVQNADPGQLSPYCRKLARAGNLTHLPGYDEGAFVVQEEGSQVVALALGARPGERILDACAGRGQKATLIATELAGLGEMEDLKTQPLAHAKVHAGQLVACDIYPAKLKLLQAELFRLGLPPATVATVDFSAGVGGVEGPFDRLLVDAPCSGVGTLRRRPELARRLRPEDPERLAELSLGILRNSASLVRPGGRVVFAVCSVLERECEAVVERVADLLSPAPFDAPKLLDKLDLNRPVQRLLPGRHGTDGYFLASFVRR